MAFDQESRQSCDGGLNRFAYGHPAWHIPCTVCSLQIAPSSETAVYCNKPSSGPKQPQGLKSHGPFTLSHSWLDAALQSGSSVLACV